METNQGRKAIANGTKIWEISQTSVLWSRGMTIRCGRISPGSNPGSARYFFSFSERRVVLLFVSFFQFLTGK